jgi:hypothetical protein
MKFIINSLIPVSLLKLNYKCKSGTVDDSNKCDTQKKSNVSIPPDSKYKSSNIKSLREDFLKVPMTSRMRSSIQWYTGSGSKYINEVRSGINNYTPEDIKYIKQRESEILDTIDKASTSEYQLLYRGIGNNEWKSIEEKGALVPGSEFHSDRVTSTTTDIDTALYFAKDRVDRSDKPKVMEIRAPPRSRALYISDISLIDWSAKHVEGAPEGFVDKDTIENEVLLGRQRYGVHGIRNDPDKDVLVVELIN